ncbi:hypothetical protein PoB_000943500 [Plakobranchus ocellatus]|uniref:Uncharacterized protein n=1 Tax=Plakobranchus ocellatus TaxID=259542 RepID=A0AAV3YKC3_9GAST|nr:hypothetical protein PoB_000943500 [Plakobranchus ocellatus]
MFTNSSVTLGFIVTALFLVSHTAAVNTLRTKEDTFSRTLPDSYRQSYAKLLATPGHLIRHVNYFHEGVYSDTLQKLTRLFFRETDHGYTDLNIANVFASDSDDTPWLLTMMNSLEALAEQDTSSHRCVNDTGHVITSVVERQTWALKCKF